MSTEASSAVVVCSIDRHRVALPAGRVDVVGEHRDAELEGERSTDVAAILGVPAPHGPRRALRVLAGGVARWLVIGTSVAVHRLPADAFVAFPEWLGAMSTLRPFTGLVSVDGAYAFELDLTRLPDAEAP